MGRTGMRLAALAAILGGALPPGAGAWEIGAAREAAPTIVGDYADAGLFGPAAARRPAGPSGDPLVLDDDPAACVAGAEEPCPARRRIVVDPGRPLDPSAVAALIGAGALRLARDEAGPGAIEPTTLLDQTPVYAPDVGATKWRTVFFSVEGMTRKGPKPLDSSGPIRSTADFIGALLQPAAVLAFLLVFFATAIVVFKRQATAARFSAGGHLRR